MSGTGASFVEVALPVPLRRAFNYRIPGAIPRAGTRVMVPFGNRTLVGWVLGPGKQVPGVRNVLSVIDTEPSLVGGLLELAHWIAGYYVAPLGVVLRSMLPARMADASRNLLVPLRSPGSDEALSPGEARILAAVSGRPEGRSAAGVRREVGGSAFWANVRRLVERGAVGHVTKPPKLPASRTRSVVRITRPIETLDELEQTFGRAKRQREAFERLQESGGRQPLAALLDNGFARSVIRGLVDKGVAEFEKEVVFRDPFRDQAGEGRPGPIPTPDQRRVVARLADALEGGGGTFLLHGVTGSGKTLVYVELLKRVLARGESGVVLVPEIALTPQTVSSFRGAFGNQVAVMHSGLSDGERFDAWCQIKSGDKRIAIGARSAVFAPVLRPGAIIVDEEHDGSYKQSDVPRYNARDVAVVRAARAGAVCVLGSATPSLESWTNAQAEKYGLLSLPDRVGGGVLPQVRVVDMKKKGGSGTASIVGPVAPIPSSGPVGPVGAPKPPERVLSPRLSEAIHLRLSRKEQTILLLNRRGYATFALCDDCGDVAECPRCSVSMTLHRGRRRLACHHCGHTEAPPERCARCGSRALWYGGLGTEQVERILVESLPGARIARMDMDTTRGKWSHHEILGRLRDGSVDILLGTQMIAKGLDFHRVTLVGVINADVGLHLPDFRSAERTFQLLAQVAGRAGRGRLPGEVVIQTYVPDHYVIRAAVGHDYRGFVERELEGRRDPPYPPRVRMARVLVSSPNREDALANTERLGTWFRRRPGSRPEVLGPAPAPIEKLRERFRWHLLLRGSAADVGRMLRAVASEFELKGADVRMELDRDPLQLM